MQKSRQHANCINGGVVASYKVSDTGGSAEGHVTVRAGANSFQFGRFFYFHFGFQGATEM